VHWQPQTQVLSQVDEQRHFFALRQRNHRRGQSYSEKHISFTGFPSSTKEVSAGCCRDLKKNIIGNIKKRNMSPTVRVIVLPRQATGII